TLAGHAVADDLVDRGADRLGEALVVERGRVRAVVDDELVAQAIELAGGDSGSDVRADEVEHRSGEATARAHLLEFGGGLELDGHVFVRAANATPPSIDAVGRLGQGPCPRSERSERRDRKRPRGMTSGRGCA